MSHCRSVKNNHDTHRSDVGTGITNAVYAPPLISFPSTLFLLSKFVFSGIFTTQSGAEACGRQVEVTQASLSLAASTT